MDHPETQPCPSPIIWFRPTVRRVVTVAWAQSFLFVILGAIILGLLRTFEVDFESHWLFAWGLGLTSVALGPIWLTRRLARTLGAERVLSMHADGMRWRDGDAIHCFWGWEDIEAVTITGEDEPILTVEASNGKRFPIAADFEDAEPSEVRTLILDLRQKALLGLTVRPRQRP